MLRPRKKKVKVTQQRARPTHPVRSCNSCHSSEATCHPQGIGPSSLHCPQGEVTSFLHQTASILLKLISSWPKYGEKHVPWEGSRSCRSCRLRSVDLAFPQTRMALNSRPKSDGREKDASLPGTDSALSLYPGQAHPPECTAEKGEKVPEISSQPMEHHSTKASQTQHAQTWNLDFTLETIPPAVYPTQYIVIPSFHFLRAKVLKISLTPLSFTPCIQPINKVL